MGEAQRKNGRAVLKGHVIRGLVNAGVAKRTEEQREEDLVIIASMYARGYTQMEIAAEINKSREYSITYQTISKDIKLIRERWERAVVVSYEEARSKELAKLDELEKSYWDAWARSQQEQERVEEVKRDETMLGGEGGGYIVDGKVVKKVSTGKRDGSMQFLLGVERCIAQRCKILGLNAPAKLDINWREQAAKDGLDPDAVESELVREFVRQAKAMGGRGNVEIVDAEAVDVVEEG